MDMCLVPSMDFINMTGVRGNVLSGIESLQLLNRLPLLRRSSFTPLRHVACTGLGFIYIMVIGYSLRITGIESQVCPKQNRDTRIKWALTVGRRHSQKRFALELS